MCVVLVCSVVLQVGVQSLRDNWDSISQAKKLIIHLPSKGKVSTLL